MTKSGSPSGYILAPISYLKWTFSYQSDYKQNQFILDMRCYIPTVVVVAAVWPSIPFISSLARSFLMSADLRHLRFD